MSARLLAIAASLALLASAAEAANVTRGPYLQLGTPHSVVTRWRTNVPTNGWIVWGPSPSDLRYAAVDPTSTTEHVLLVDAPRPARDGDAAGPAGPRREPRHQEHDRRADGEERDRVGERVAQALDASDPAARARTPLRALLPRRTHASASSTSSRTSSAHGHESVTPQPPCP